MMRIVEMPVSPEIALGWIGASGAVDQRPLQEQRVRGMAAQMVAGEWRITHQAVAITPDGACLDGQHRLHAVILAGITVMMTVALDVDPATFDVIDVGAKRSAANILAIAGFTDSRTVAATARVYLTYQATVGTTMRWAGGRQGPISEARILAFVRSEGGRDLLGQLRTGSAIASSVGRVGIRSTLTALLAVIAEENGHTATFSSFVEHLESGARLEPLSAILAYRRFLTLVSISPTYSHSHARQQAIMLAGLKAWNEYLSGATREVMTVKLGIEKMPVPRAVGTVLG